MSEIILTDDAMQDDAAAQTLATRMQELEDEMARVNTVKASELIDWFEQDNIFLALPYRVAILRDVTPNVTAGGIIMTEVTQTQRAAGSIVRLGTELQNRKDPSNQEIWAGEVLAVGDRCTFSKYGESVHQLAFSNGKEVILDVLHVRDIYFYWRNEDIDAKDPGQEFRKLM